MKTLENAKVKQTYIVTNIHAQEELLHHLHDLGMKNKAKISLVTLSKDNGIVLLHHARFALDRSILRLIEVEEMERDEENWLSLSEVKVENFVRVVSIHGSGAVKRRLMDMGITKGVEIHVRKVAPLGDPVELNLRGYELTLRKSEAEMVLVTPISPKD